MMPEHDSVFTDAELAYLHDRRRLARIATVGADGTPHVVPVGWTHNRDEDTIDVPWRPRAIEVRGRAEALPGPQPVIRIHPERIVPLGPRRTTHRAQRPPDRHGATRAARLMSLPDRVMCVLAAADSAAGVSAAYG